MVMPSKRSGGRHSDSDLDNVACRISNCQYKQKKTFKEEAYPVIKQHAAQASCFPEPRTPSFDAC